MTATPRNMDPKFKDETVTPDEQTATDDNMTKSDEVDETPYIAHKRTWTDSEGRPQEKTDRMKLVDFPAYQKKWGI